MGVPLAIIHFRLGFSQTKTIHFRAPPWLWKHPNDGKDGKDARDDREKMSPKLAMKNIVNE